MLPEKLFNMSQLKFENITTFALEIVWWQKGQPNPGSTQAWHTSLGTGHLPIKMCLYEHSQNILIWDICWARC